MRDLGTVLARLGARPDRLGGAVLRISVAFRGAGGSAAGLGHQTRARRESFHRTCNSATTERVFSGMTARFALPLLCGLAATAAGAPGEVVRVEHRDPNALPSRGPSNALVTIELFFTPGSGSHAPGYRYLEK